MDLAIIKYKKETFKLNLLIPSLSSGSHEKTLPSMLTPYSTVPFSPCIISCQNAFSISNEERSSEMQNLLENALFAIASNS